jgi:hypothetical protein
MLSTDSSRWVALSSYLEQNPLEEDAARPSGRKTVRRRPAVASARGTRAMRPLAGALVSGPTAGVAHGGSRG